METPLAMWHIVKALNILSDRMSVADENVVADSTISVVISMVLAGDFIADYKAAENHMRGLYKLVVMRGGLAGLHGDTWGLQTKVLR